MKRLCRSVVWQCAFHAVTKRETCFHRVFPSSALRKLRSERNATSAARYSTRSCYRHCGGSMFQVTCEQPGDRCETRALAALRACPIIRSVFPNDATYSELFRALGSPLGCAQRSSFVLSISRRKRSRPAVAQIEFSAYSASCRPREIVIEKEISFRCHVALDAFQLSCLRNNQITRFPLANRTQSPKCNVLRLDFNIFILMVRYELTGHNSSCRLNRERTNDLAQ